MNGRHWTEDDFLNRVYGLTVGDESHLTTCVECRNRANEFELKRAGMTAEPEISHEFLAAQRRAIYRRLDHPLSHPFRWASALAATLMVVMGLLFFHPASTPQPQNPKADDAVFADVYALEQSSEPQAAKPIEALFEDN